MMNNFNKIISIKEASLIWGVATSTIRMAIKNNRFRAEQIKKSGGTWLILKSAMESLYGIRTQTKCLYTIGYEGKTIEAFLNILTENKIDVIFDVREFPISRKKGFSKNSLAEILNHENISYLGFKNLGSPKELRQNLYKTCDHKTFFKNYKKYVNNNSSYLNEIIDAFNSSSYKKVCLLCFEKTASLCHRSELAKLMLKNNKNISQIINL